MASSTYPWSDENTSSLADVCGRGYSLQEVIKMKKMFESIRKAGEAICAEVESTRLAELEAKLRGTSKRRMVFPLSAESKS